MPAPKFRGEYSALAGIAQTFSQNAEATRQTLQRIKQALETLQNGDWIGQGADKFYQEMSAQVVPALTRLGNALASAAQVTGQMSKIIKTAEDDAARVFRLGGESGVAEGPLEAGLGAAIGATIGSLIAPGLGTLVGGAIGAAVGAGVNLGGSGGGSGSGSGGGGTGGGDGGGGGAGGSGPTPGSTGNAAADRMLKDLPPEVRDLVAKSPTLVRELEQLENAGWHIEVTNTPGSYADRTAQKIVVQGGRPTEAILRTLAHESGHAVYNKPTHPDTPGMTREEFVRLNTHEELLDEGNAQMNAAGIREEIINNGGPDVKISGSQTAEYLRLYQSYKDGTLTREAATEQMAVLMGQEVGSKSGLQYKSKWENYYGQVWDRAHPGGH